MRIIRSTGVAVLMLMLAAMFGDSGRSWAADARSKDEKALMETDAAWSKASATKNVDRIISYYSDDSSVFPPNQPLAKGKEAIQNMWNGLVANPGFSLSWEPKTATVAKSGDLGYTTGTYQFSMTAPDGKPVSDKGKYVVVWKKSADGKWKAVADIFNSDLPATPPKQG